MIPGFDRAEVEWENVPDPPRAWKAGYDTVARSAAIGELLDGIKAVREIYESYEHSPAKEEARLWRELGGMWSDLLKWQDVLEQEQEQANRDWKREEGIDGNQI